MRRNSGFCARSSRSRGVLMVSDSCRSRQAASARRDHFRLRLRVDRPS
jgi:hypothetical protein